MKTTTPLYMQKKIWLLAAVTAFISVFFSFMGAPFLRALFAKTKSVWFWALGVVTVAILFSVQLTLGAVYVGAVWMTLGAYSELETRGVSWKKTSVISLFAGLIFAVLGFSWATKGSLTSDLAKELVQPFLNSLQQLYPDNALTAEHIIQYMPGVLLSALMCSLAVGIVFETQIFQLFKFRREKTASSLKWLEFRLPDVFIWFAFLGFFFALVRLNFLPENVATVVRTIALNISIFSAFCFFLQGIVVFEFLSRFYRIGLFTKTILYFLILTWIGPAVGMMGLLDYWLNFRNVLRKKINEKN